MLVHAISSSNETEMKRIHSDSPLPPMVASLSDPTSESLLQFFVETDGDFAALAARHRRVGLVHFVEREAVGLEVGRMQVPAHQALHQFLHQPGGSYPTPKDGLLIVDDVGRRVELHASPFARSEE